MTPLQVAAHVSGYRRPSRGHAWLLAIAAGLAVAAYGCWMGWP